MGLTFNGVHCSTFGLKAKVTRPLLPGNSDTYTDVPGRAGSILYPGKPKDRYIPVEFGFMPGSRAEFRSRVWEISAWLYTEERKILICDDEPDKYYIGKIEDQIDLEQAYLLGQFSIVFRCEPFAYGTEVISYFADDTVTVTNVGTAGTEPYFQSTLTATAAEWKVALGTDYVRVVHDFQIGDELIMNFATGAILLNGARAMNLLDWQNSRFFFLPPGESTMNITPAGKSTTLLKYTPKWL